ncbi:hypothetical protein [Terrimonas alba]|uniref:hypothetical protein n=1 Tax=Terrimonas alba TaxID=3349636 RepID=UPI0035F36FA8
MPNFKLQQLKHESDMWKRVLGFMKEENIHLKNRLSEILKTDISNDLLMKAEAFQNSFVREDDLIRFLQSDIAVFDKLLIREIFENGTIMNKLTENLKTIRKNISNAERQFNKLKLEFNNYLLEYQAAPENLISKKR